MKQSSLRLINQIDDNDTALMEKVFLFLTTSIPHRQPIGSMTLTDEQRQRVQEVEELCGAFSACQTKDWKKDKGEYLLEKYG